MALTLVTPPAVEPVSLAEAKVHLGADGTETDALISGLISAAREYCEGVQRRAYVTQTRELTLDEWPTGREIRLPVPPLQSVTSITYMDADGAERTMPITDYIVDAKSEPGRIVLAAGASWPSVTLLPVGGITVQFVAGYGAAEDVPPRVKQAILLLVGHWYANREAVVVGTVSRSVEFTVDALLWQDRVW